MFRKIIPKEVTHRIEQFPHCDQRILHAPGECEYCDHHAEWQALRVAWGIAFTGYEPEGLELPCPATKARGESILNKWPGNIPVKKTASFEKPVDRKSIGTYQDRQLHGDDIYDHPA